MKKLRQLKIDTILSLMFGLCFLASFVGGFFAKFVYQVNNNEPVWLNSVVVATLEGTFICSWGMFGMLTAKKQWTRTSCGVVRKAGAVLIFLFGIILLLLGLIILWRAIGNLPDLYTP